MILGLYFSAYLLAEDALIWYPDGTAANSANAIQTELTANAKTSVLTTDLAGHTLANYDYLFICLGLYPNTYVLADEENGADIDKVISYLSTGGNVYMEGGDTWAWDDPTDLHSRFNIHGVSDGEADLGTIHGASCFSDLSFTYSGNQQYIDHIAPIDGAFVLLTNENPAYACGVGYENGYRTFGASFEFGGLTGGENTQTELMAQILNFFDNGCSGGKPAPLNVHAFGGYDNAVPLVWETPPGQQPPATSQQLLPSLATSHRQPNVVNRKTAAGRKRQESQLSKLMAIQGVGYQANSFNIYRSTSESGPFTRIVSNVDRLYYRDETVTNGTTYYYYITSVYDGQEGDASRKASAQPSAQNSGTSPWKFTTPIIDGHIQADEWDNALAMEITAEGEPNAATLYIFHDDNNIYFALDDAGNPTLDIDDQFGLNFDTNLDFDWPGSTLTDEGTIWLFWDGTFLGTLFRGLYGNWPFDIGWSEPVDTTGMTCAVSTTSGHVQYESQMDLSRSVISMAPGDKIGMYTYSLNMPDSITTASWPSAVSTAFWNDSWMLPVLYGTLTLEEKGTCPKISDTENVTATASYEFNEFGDGRKVEMSFAELTGAGIATVEQTNGCLNEPIHGQYINCVWSLSKDAGISDFTVDISFHYNENDVSGLEESKLQVHWWNGVAWQFEGGTVDPALNKVTLRTNHFGDFSLFERDHVLLNAKVFLQGAYDSNNLMRTTLNDENLIPLTSTFSDARVLHNIPEDVCDWVMVELRYTADGTAVSQRSFPLKKDGSIVDWDGITTDFCLPDAADGDYYVVISHRNHLSVMSATTTSLTANVAGSIDFTNTLDSYYGHDAKLLETGVFGMYAGDANGDGFVQDDDINNEWKSVVGSSGYLSSDLNLNGHVQNDDKNDYWKQNEGHGTQVP